MNDLRVPLYTTIRYIIISVDLKFLDLVKQGNLELSSKYLGMAFKIPKGLRIFVGCEMLLFMTKPLSAMASDFKDDFRHHLTTQNISKWQHNANNCRMVRTNPRGS